MGCVEFRKVNLIHRGTGKDKYLQFKYKNCFAFTSKSLVPEITTKEQDVTIWNLEALRAKQTTRNYNGVHKTCSLY